MIKKLSLRWSRFTAFPRKSSSQVRDHAGIAARREILGFFEGLWTQDFQCGPRAEDVGRRIGLRWHRSIERPCRHSMG